MNEILFLVEEAPEGGYSARGLGHSVYTEADTWPELATAVREAVSCHFDAALAPRMVHLQLVREEAGHDGCREGRSDG